MSEEWLPNLELFRKGERLIVAPSDADDPEAMAREGQACTFVRMSPHGFAVVRFSEDARKFYFRPKDLRSEEAR